MWSEREDLHESGAAGRRFQRLRRSHAITTIRGIVLEYLLPSPQFATATAYFLLRR